VVVAQAEGTIVKERAGWLGYGALGLLILGPLLWPGYILTLDMSWTPHLSVRANDDNAKLFYEMIRGLSTLIPSMLLQKLLLCVTFALTGMGAYKLIREQLAYYPAAYLAGLVYVVNPFTYTRLMAGQYLVLLGYALLSWFVWSLWRLLERPSRWRAMAVAGWAVAIGLVSLHAVGMAFLLAVAVSLTWGWGRWRQLGRQAGLLLTVAGTWLIVNSFWLVPALLGRSARVGQITGFGADQFAAYATAPGDVGVLLNTLTLQGFWGDSSGLYKVPSATGILFWLAFGALAVLVMTGLCRAVRQHDRLGLALGAAGLAAWVLAMGQAWGPAAALTHWLVQHVPFYRGYREPQKWLMVLALAYAYLAAFGLSWLLLRLRGWKRELMLGLALAFPLLWAPMMLWGAAGQLRSVDYPASWYELKTRLAAQTEGGKVLMLPWHQYIYLDFARRTVAHPGPAFFGARAVVSDNAELLGTHSDPVRPVDDVVEGHLLATAGYGQDAGARLAPLGFRYVVLLKQADWRDYGWLDQQADLRQVAETIGWKLYEVEATK
jgi:hypothetical protein